MNKPIIAVDVDDVLADSTEALRLEVNKRLGIELTAEHYRVDRDHYWGYYESIWADHGIADQITLAELDPQMIEDQSHVQRFDQSSEVLRSLAERFEFIIVTGRNSSWRLATERWLEQHYPGIFTKILFGDGPTGLAQKSKGEICAEEGVQWLIDDNVEHAAAAFERGINVILFGDYGWQHNVPASMVRCKDWQAVGEYFDGIK